MSRAGRRVNAKSIMGVMMLAAGKGSTVTIETIGADHGIVDISPALVAQVESAMTAVAA